MSTIYVDVRDLRDFAQARIRGALVLRKSPSLIRQLAENKINTASVIIDRDNLWANQNYTVVCYPSHPDLAAISQAIAREGRRVRVLDVDFDTYAANHPELIERRP